MKRRFPHEDLKQEAHRRHPVLQVQAKSCSYLVSVCIEEIQSKHIKHTFWGWGLAVWPLCQVQAMVEERVRVRVSAIFRREVKELSPTESEPSTPTPNV